ncbi:MAG: aminotransferase class V-fold PLP-dependent enzyme [Planctomycetes bacterium]|nr:aminotransferase class V-fold PLP-dependent enzyme [Planctomycetota bacterium]
MLDHAPFADGLPHPSPDEIHKHAAQIVNWLLADFTALPQRPVGTMASPAQMQAWLGQPLPEEGQGLDAVLKTFGELVAPFAFRPNHPRFIAFIPSAPSYYSILGDWLCAGINLFAGVWLEAAGATQVELVVLDWFKELLGYPPGASGILTGGGSEANLTALLVARESLSFADRGRAILYVNQHRHWSVDRAARTIGLHPDQVRPIPAGTDFRVHGSALAEASTRDTDAGKLPWAMVATAGATSTGIVDDLASIADVCRQHGLWFHVDAAYGWSASLVPAGKALLHGLERADSITLDPHKWFAQTFEAGCVLVRDGQRLRDTFAHSPEYMQDVRPADDEVNFADLGLALSRRFRALKIWFSIKVLGIGWFRALIQHTCALAEHGERLLQQAECFERLSPRALSMVCFRYRPKGSRGDTTEEELDRLNLALCAAVRDSGKAFLSSTRLNEHVALRFCFVNWRTTPRDVEEIVELLVSLKEKL